MNKEVLKVLVGSHNYGLNTENSDKDYKIFVLPSFDDLYYSKKISTSTVKSGGVEEDVEVKDIRLLIELLKKANPAYLEILFSVEVHVSPIFNNIWKFLQTNKEKIVEYNLLNFFNATWGTMYEKAKSLRQKKYTESNKKLFDELGYDPKQMCHFMRLAALLEDYRMGDFINCFGYCLSLKSSNSEYLINLKNGKLKYTDFYENILTTTLDSTQAMKECFTNTTEEKLEHKKIFGELDLLIKNLVQDYITGELLPF